MRYNIPDAALHDAALPSPRQRIREANKDDATGDLFALPSVHSETSKAAAEDVHVTTAAKRMLDVHNVVTASGSRGLIRNEIADQLGVQVNYITSTVDRLLRLGEFVETARTRVNPASGKQCAVIIDKRFAYAEPKEAA